MCQESKEEIELGVHGVAFQSARYSIIFKYYCILRIQDR